MNTGGNSPKGPVTGVIGYPGTKRLSIEILYVLRNGLLSPIIKHTADRETSNFLHKVGDRKTGRKKRTGAKMGAIKKKK